MNNAVALNQLVSAENLIWVCGENNPSAEGPFCSHVDAHFGIEFARFELPWGEISSVFRAEDASRVFIVGRTVDDAFVSTSMANCETVDQQLHCQSSTFHDTSIEVASYVPFATRTIYIGKYANQLFATIFDATKGTFNSYIYSGSTNAMKTIDITHAQSPPGYVGTFVAGTCVSTASVNYIYAGVVRADSGIMTAMYVLPSRGTIINSAELVNTMALENTRPDSFIAGGLRLNDNAGMHAYLLCVNSFFNSVEFGVRYQAQDMTGISCRRTLRVTRARESAVKTMVLVNSALFLVVDIVEVTGAGPHSSICVAKVDIQTGEITQQVQIESPNVRLSCSNVVASTSPLSSPNKMFLYLTCAAMYINHTQQVLLSVNQDLTLSALPSGFRRYQNTTLRAEKVTFKRVSLPLSTRIAAMGSVESAFTVENGIPTFHPSVSPISKPSSQPSKVPSGQPSSSPSAGPSVSPQPTSQPSTSGPTNTYKPTVKPTQRPSTKPSCAPSARPSRHPSRVPTNRPTTKPSVKPSAALTVAPTKVPTRAPSTKATHGPTTLHTITPTVIPSEAPSVSNDVAPTTTLATTVLSYCVGILFGLWCLYHLRNWCAYKVNKLKDDKQFMLQMKAQNLPVHPRYPIFSALVALFCVVVPSAPRELAIVELHLEEEEEERTLETSATIPTKRKSAMLPAKGSETEETAVDAQIREESPFSTPGAVKMGAYINGPNFVDSEDDEKYHSSTGEENDRLSNISTDENNKTLSQAPGEDNVVPRAMANSSSDMVVMVSKSQETLHVHQPVTVTHSRSAISLHDSDDSSFLSDVVNAMMMEDSVNSSLDSSTEDEHDSVSTGSSDSEDSDNSQYNSDV